MRQSAQYTSGEKYRTVRVAEEELSHVKRHDDLGGGAQKIYGRGDSIGERYTEILYQ